MSSDFSPELRGELLDDFYAECDELLTRIRADLTRLDDAARGSQPDASVIESLFRSVHSVKGISAIVGLRPAENLSHGMEDLLRGLSKNALPLTARTLDLLLMAAQRLEQIVAAHRSGHSLPDIADTLDQLQRELPSPATSGAAAPAHDDPPAAVKPDPAQAAVERGLKLFRVSLPLLLNETLAG
jgi:two-component system chemotaxis sensor kinase CheA